MKRIRDSPSSGNPGPKHPPLKRAKAGQACISCRKQKTRCELLDSTRVGSRCHRCSVLAIACSFESGPPAAHTPNDGDESSKTSRLREFVANVLTSPSSLDTSTSVHLKGYGSPWDFIEVAELDDWTATPVLAMQILARSTCPAEAPHMSMSVPTFAQIMSSEEKLHLLNIFDTHYAPWMSMPHHPFDEEEILTLVRCTIASRHLDPVLRAHVAPGLRKLTEEAMVKHVFNPKPSQAAAQAFAMLSLWSPTNSILPTSSDTHDSRLISVSAVNMCSSLHFDQAAAEEKELSTRARLGDPLTSEESALLASAEYRHKMWICMHNVESLVCLGTGRDATSRIVGSVLTGVGFISHTTLEGARRLRMALTARLLDITNRGLALKLSDDFSQGDRFYEEVSTIMQDFQRFHRLAFPLPVATDYEQFYFHALLIVYHFCRLLFLTQTLRDMRRQVIPANLTVDNFFFAKIRQTACGLALTCARDALLASESLLTILLSIGKKDLLATAPDYLFNMIAFGAAFVVASKFMFLHAQGPRHLPGSSDQILRRSVALLNQIAPSSEHPAARCATVITQFIQKWEVKMAAVGLDDTGRKKRPGAQEGLSSTSTLPTQDTVESEGPSPASVISDPDPYAIFNPMMMFDFMDTANLDANAVLPVEFWQLFAEPSNSVTDAVYIPTTDS